MSNSHEVGVWPDRFVLGVSNPRGPHLHLEKKTGITSPFEPTVAASISLKEALETEYGTNALLTCYRAVDEKGNVLPQHYLFHKTSLTKIREEGADLQQTCIGLDWDTGSGAAHVDLTDELLASFLEKFEEAIEADPLLKPWYAMYSTNRGTRVFYLLDEPVPADDGEKIAAAIRQRFKKAGVEFDTACSDWSRRYLLPQVTRKGKRTNQNDLYFLDITGDELEASSIPKVMPSELFRPRTYTPSSMYPDSQQCKDRLMVPGSGGGDIQSPFLKRAKQLLKPTIYHKMFFTEDAHFPDENRHQFLLKVVGFLTPLLMRKAGAKPEDIFALMYEPVCQWDPQTCDEDPHAHAWTIVQNIYAKEQDNYNEEMEVKSEEAAEGRELIDQMMEGMREWCDDDELHASVDTGRQFVIDHLFANMDGFYFPMKENGWYSSVFLRPAQLVSRIRRTFLNNLIPTTREDSRGNEVDVSQQTIMNNHTTMVTEVGMTPLQRVNGGKLNDVDGHMPKLTLPMFRRSTTLKAEFNPYVDGWLRAIFAENYEAAANWFAHALAFEDGIICALSIKAPTSIGKKMLAVGLSECLEYPALAPAEDVCGRFGNIIERTPFVYINEEWPKEAAKAPSDIFRKLTGGDPLTREQKGRPLILINNPIRMIMTANDHGLRDGILSGKDQSPETKKAIGQRLLHFDAGDEGADYLKELGGPGFTTALGHAWVAGDNGEPSDFVVAKHFLWLYENRKPRDTSNRYCVMGNCEDSSSDLFQVATHSGNMPPVMHALIEMMENSQPVPTTKKIDGEYLVTRFGILSHIREFRKERITETELEQCLRNVVADSTPRVIQNKEFFSIDVSMLAMFASRWGITAKKTHEWVDKET